MRLRTFIDRSLAAQDRKALFDALKAFVGDFGADLLSYHVVVENLLRVRFEDGFYYHCFPDAWVRRYEAQGYFAIDPIIAAAMRVHEPFHWFDVGRLAPLTPAQEAYLDDLRAHGMIDGLAVPIFSANATTAYFGVGSTRAPMALGETDMLEIQYACNQAHLQFLDMRRAESPPPVALSKRETEVLGWVVRGKSNSVIGEILGISNHTVDTLVRRIFAKLAVQDRIAASIKAVGMGLVAL